jgi:hypothetical protein
VLFAPVFGVGLIAGPSIGHFYAENTAQAWRGIATRGGAALTAGLGMGLLFSPAVVCPDSGPCSARKPLGPATGPVGVALYAIGLVGGAASLVYDIVTVPRAARERNRSRGLSLRLAPEQSAGGGVGLALQVQF